MADFLFAEAQVRQPVRTLSGGERNRLLLARLFTRTSDLLVMDEPTNDLDMDTLDRLIETLDAYDGTLILVSHDRDFVDKLVTSLIVLEGGGQVTEYIGGYRDYLRQRKTAGTEAAKSRRPSKEKESETKPDRRREAGPRKLSYKDQRELDGLPGVIGDLEGEIEALNLRLAAPDFFAKDPDGFSKAAARLETAKAELEGAEARWLELEDLRESLEVGNPR